MLVDRLVQRGPGQELGGDPGASALGLRPQHPRHTRAADRPRGERLTDEALGKVLVVGEFRAEHLHRGDRPGPVLAGVHLAHAALAQYAEQAVRAETNGVAGAQGFHR